MKKTLLVLIILMIGSVAFAGGLNVRKQIDVNQLDEQLTADDVQWFEEQDYQSQLTYKDGQISELRNANSELQEKLVNCEKPIIRVIETTREIEQVPMWMIIALGLAVVF
jgi:peptidoglycan hydrolase CwlO-like protein